MRPQRSTSRWAAAFGGAVVVNALVVLHVVRAPAPSSPSRAPIDVVMLAPSGVAIPSIDPDELLAAAKRAAPPKPAPVAPPPPPPPHPMQVVETAKPAVETPPDHARFASEYNTKVDHETVARSTSRLPMVAKPAPGAVRPPREAPAEPPLVRPMGAHAPGVLAMREPSAVDGYMKKRIDAGPRETARGDAGPNETAPARHAPDLRAPPEALQRAGGGGGSVDHVENVVDGDATALNSVRWVYASFFNRLKRQVAQNWDPNRVWRRDDPTGHVYGVKTRVTVVRVSLTTTGAIANIIVVSPSGVGDLDDEAVRAFQAAGPFPNPPTELAGRDGLITFGFSFYFEIDHSDTAWNL